jgi:hypothetical protein
LTASTRFLGSRLYIYDGPLAKNKSGRKLHGYLFNDLLLLVEPKNKQGTVTGKTNQYCLYEKPMPLTELIIREVPKSGPGGKDVGVVDDCSFQIVHIDKNITLRASSPSEKKQWMNICESYISQAEKKIAFDSNQNVSQKTSKNMIGTLQVYLLEAKKLTGSDKIRIKPSVFCNVILDNQTIRSKTSQSWPPKWSQEMLFSVFSLDQSLKISMYNYDRYSKDEYMGQVSIQLDFLEYYNGKETEKMTLDLKDAKGGMIVLQMAYRPISLS